MKKSIYLISAVLAINSSALDINEAIEYSLSNNYTVKEKKVAVLENKELVESSKSLYKPKVDIKYTYDNKFETNPDDNKNDSELNIDLTYNLFNGYADIHTVKSTENNLQTTRYDYKGAQYDIILMTKQDFIACLQAQKNTIVQTSALKLFQIQYDDAKNFYDNGINITLNNLLEVEINLLQAKKLLKEAISSEKIAIQKLFNTMGIKIEEKIEDIPLNKDKYTKYLDEKMIVNSARLSSLQEYKNSLINEREALTGTYYPKVDATLQHKRYGDDLALNERGGTYKPQNIALLQVSWNLYNGNKNQSDIISYKHRISQVYYQIEQLKQDLNFEYIEAKEQLILSIQNLEISKKAFKQSKINYKIVSNSFKEGIVTSKELVDANYLLSKSEVAYYDAYYTNLLAIATIERLLEINEL